MQSCCPRVRSLLADYRALLARGLPPPPRAFPPLLKACAASPSALLPLALSLHLHALVLGHAPADPYLASSLLHFYSKSGSLASARRLFDAIPDKCVVPYSAIIAAYSQAGDAPAAFSLFSDMLRGHGGPDARPNSITFLSLLSGDAAAPLPVQQVQCVHSLVVRCGFESDIVLSNSLVNAYGKCGSLALARRLFDEMPIKDVVSWNSLISSYAKVGCDARDTLELFMNMRSNGVHPDHQTHASLVSSIAYNRGGGRELFQTAKPVHALVLASGCGLDGHVQTALISMYLKLRDYDSAFLLFERASDQSDVVLWSAMMSGLVQNGGADKALQVFSRMLDSDLMPAATTIASVLSACAQLEMSRVGKSIHGYIVRRRLLMDVAVQNSLVSMYAKCDSMKQSVYVFEMMGTRDLISWNAVISGCAENGHLSEAFFLFRRMRMVPQRPDIITIVSLLQLCASVGALRYGMLVHGLATRLQLIQSISLNTSLVDMYSKCGDLQSALKCFHSMPEHDLVSWGAIISGFGSHGMGEVALQVYRDFLERGMEPNDVILLSVLSACSHAGLVSEGLAILKFMTEQLIIKPDIEHWGCAIDLLCKAGRLEEALGFINTMSPRPNADILGMLLDACRTYGFESLAEQVAKRIAALRPASAGSYIQLAHSYAAMSRWDNVGETWIQMKSLGLKKAPAWSSIELNGNVTAFYAKHHSHPWYDEIMFMLKIIYTEIMDARRISRYIYNL